MRGNLHLLGTKVYDWNDPLHSSHAALEQAYGRADNRKCEICGAVGAECLKHRPKQERPKTETVTYDGIRFYKHTIK